MWSLVVAAVCGLCADYQRMETLSPQNLRGKFLNLSVSPVWLPDGKRFWYRRDTVGGWEFVAVDPDKRTRTPAFDPARLARGISDALGGVPASPQRLALNELSFADRRGSVIRFNSGGMTLTCKISDYRCTGTVEPAHTDVVVSPDGREGLFIRDHNLWIRELVTGTERSLTSDGEADFAYGRAANLAPQDAAVQSGQMAARPTGLSWSPDSRFVVTSRVDERGVPEYPYIEYLPSDRGLRPQVLRGHPVLKGEGSRRRGEVRIIDTLSGVAHILQLGNSTPDSGDEGLYPHLWWDLAARRFIALRRVVPRYYARSQALVEVDAYTGAVRTVLEEQSDTFVQAGPVPAEDAVIRVLPKTREAIWYSEASGWGHLYLVDIATGRSKQLTGGEWAVQSIVSVDEKHRRLYFTASGREPDEDPYFRHLYSVGLDGRGLRLLTTEVADHVFPSEPNPEFPDPLPPAPPRLMSPDGRFFIDTFSTVSQPPRSVLKDVEGHAVLQLEVADASAAVASGWQAPQPFKVQAVDGVTELRGVLIRSPRVNDTDRHPVLDRIYDGPQSIITPHNFVEAATSSASMEAQGLAQLGFVLVIMDGRGTPRRSRAFHEFSYNRLGEGDLEDHVAAITILAQRFGFLDLERVGLFGATSHMVIRGLTRFPDFFKAGAAVANVYDLSYTRDNWDNLYAPAPVDVRRATHLDVSLEAAALKGHLLLAYGDLDDNVYPVDAVNLIAALVAANKDFDLVYMPGRTHSLVNDPYVARRQRDFFIRYLLGARP